METGKRTIGKARNTFKQDYIVYLGGGMGGGGAVTQAGVDRFTYWVDHNPFATSIRRLVTINHSFELWAEAFWNGFGYGAVYGTEVPLYVSFDQSNDRPPEMFTADAEISGKRVVVIPPTQPPPYYFNTTNVKQPVDPRFITDQGNFVYYAYETGGLGITRTGVNDFVAQSFVPTSPLLSSIFLRDIFHIGDYNDPARFRDIIVELWDSNRGFYANLGIIPKEFIPGIRPNNHTDMNGNRITTATDTWITASDSNKYWIEITEARCIPRQPIKVVPGQTYYIVLRHTSPIADFLYGVGANTSGGVYNGKGRYIYGGAFSGVGVAGSNTVTASPTDVSICFTTQRNVGRTAVTFYWGNPAYWWSDPNSGPAQFEFVKEDFDQAEI
jgi:hypothetical protein